LNSGVIELAEGIRRVTFPLPLGIDHVHCYFLRAGDGSWTLVDTGLGLPGGEERWEPVLGSLDGPVERIVVTHFHPDHVGDAATVAELTSAPVFEGRLDREQSVRIWGGGAGPERYLAHLRSHGMPAIEVDELGDESAALRQLVHLPAEPQPLEPGDTVDGWRVLHLPGHADGHLALLRDGVLIAGDTILSRISPIVGVYPDARPDPLGDFLASLETIVELAPTIAFAGHEEPVTDPAGRARELELHHRKRLDDVSALLSRDPRSGYDVAIGLFGAELAPSLRRFALAEALAHLERLVREGRAERADEDGAVLYLTRSR
jgi:glyoxylase-like metal-dependent hydrolase (beta-lactamase superfamily II)